VTVTAGDGAEMTWIIERTLAEGDLEEIVAIEAASFSNPWTRQMYLRELQNPDVSFLYVLRVPVEGEGRSDSIAGFCSFWLVLDEIHINNLAIRPEDRGRGLGAALLRHVLQAGARRGAERATLEVRRSNAPARRLYESLGFALAATRPNYYASPPEDALILWKGELNESRSNA
jgi:[ribosomal protein S18]-alanine N-acetyltransferase